MYVCMYVCIQGSSLPVTVMGCMSVLFKIISAVRSRSTLHRYR